VGGLEGDMQDDGVLCKLVEVRDGGEEDGGGRRDSHQLSSSQRPEGRE